MEKTINEKTLVEGFATYVMVVPNLENYTVEITLAKNQINPRIVKA